MSSFAEFLIGLVMAIGIVGAAVPVLPGLWLTWLAGFAWASLDGGGGTRWTLFALMTLFFAVGSYASFALPASTITGRQSRRTLAVATLFAIAGFFVLPVVGLPLGFALGTFAMTVAAGSPVPAATRTTVATLRAFGMSVVVQVMCGLAIAAMLVLGLILT